MEKLKLNPLQARWLMKPALISSFFSVKWMSLWLGTPWWDTYSLQVNSRQILVLINLPRKDGKLSYILGREEGLTNI